MISMNKRAVDSIMFRKVCIIGMVLNAASLFCVLVAITYEFVRNYNHINSLFQSNIEIAVFIFIVVLVVFDAVSNVLLCKSAIKMSQISDSIRLSHDNLDKLNSDMRKQRHDFMNNLQVIHGLISMDCYQEAKAYIDSVYTDIRSISRILKTDSPAINALLQAKVARCDELNIPVNLEIMSTFKDDMPMPEWLVCRILGNLIDNAIYAISDKGQGHLHIVLTEDVNAHSLSVSDDGTAIPSNSMDKLFIPGFSTKGDNGTGMGLAICNDLVREYHGTISVKIENQYKIFTAIIPKTVSK